MDKKNIHIPIRYTINNLIPFIKGVYILIIAWFLIIIPCQNLYGQDEPNILFMPDAYEEDNNKDEAKPFLINQPSTIHNFHSLEDVDWMYFYAYKGLNYEVRVEKDWMDCQILIDVFAPNEEPMVTPGEEPVVVPSEEPIGTSSFAVVFEAKKNGFYYVKVSNLCDTLPMAQTFYRLFIEWTVAGRTGGIYGIVRDKKSGEGIAGAKINISQNSSQNPSNAIDWDILTLDKWRTNDSGKKIGWLDKGFFCLFNMPSGSGYILEVEELPGYEREKIEDIEVRENEFQKIVFDMIRINDAEQGSRYISQNLLKKNIDMIEKLPESIFYTMQVLDIDLNKGLNLFSYPLKYPDPYNVSDFLITYEPGFQNLSKETEYFLGIGHYDDLNTYHHLSFDTSLQKDYFITKEEDFLIKAGEANAIYIKQKKSISFNFPSPNVSLCLKKGLNLVGIPNPPYDYTSYKMLKEIKKDVISISKYDPKMGQWMTAYWNYNHPCGPDFPISPGVGYMICVKEKKDDWSPSH